MRSDEGEAVTPPPVRESSSRTKNNQFISGTSCSVANGRRMKTPPANIFVWGLLEDTTKDDIVADLSLSGITVTESDIEMKSKPESRMKSYRISVPAHTLSMALDPSIWPLGVKVREYVFYSRRRETGGAEQQRESQQGGRQQRRNRTGSVISAPQANGVSTGNRFDVLADQNPFQ